MHRCATGSSELDTEQIISLLDSSETGSLRCRHFDGIIPPIKRIFTTNIASARDAGDGDPRSPIFPRGANTQQQFAINRRFCSTEYIKTKLY